jgi:hypothetical protein
MANHLFDVDPFVLIQELLRTICPCSALSSTSRRKLSVRTDEEEEPLIDFSIVLPRNEDFWLPKKELAETLLYVDGKVLLLHHDIIGSRNVVRTNHFGRTRHLHPPLPTQNRPCQSRSLATAPCGDCSHHVAPRATTVNQTDAAVRSS